ncbi:MAG: FemAB family XrtA/PEP-CTERM system-associated protein [Planctomycetota bacterium]
MTSEAFVTVVIPVTNPGLETRPLIEGYTGPLESAGYPFEIVFVLDGVHGRVPREIAECEDPRVRSVRLQGDGLGESIALSAGAARAKGGFVVQVPQYLQIEPEDIVKVVQALESGADFVATWRHPRVDPWFNRVQSALFNWLLRVVMGIRFHDLNSSVRGMRRHILDEVNVYGELFRFLPVLAQRQGFQVVEIKVRHLSEQGGFGFYGVGVYIRRLLDILAITFLTRFTQKPLRFFGIAGALVILFGIALSIGPLWDRFFEAGSLTDRPRFVLGSILVAFGFQMIGLGLIGEIIIFTQASQLRDYKIDELLDGGSGEVSEVHPIVEENEDAEGLAPVGRVRELLPGEDARWDSFVREHPDGSFFHLTGWRRAVHETFGHEPHYLVHESGRAWQGVLPLHWVKSPFIGRHLISVPYAVYGGVLSRREDVQEALVQAASQQGRRLKAGYLELRHDRARETEGGTPHELYVTFRKRLPDAPEEVLPSIPKKARAEVRRARDRHGMTFEQSEDVNLFFNLFSEEKRRLGTPSLPLRWFQSLMDEFGRQVVIHVVRDSEGTAQCAVMSFLFRDTVYAYYSGSRTSARGTGVSDFVYCKIQEWSVENGFRVFDFGRSRRDTGAAKFKKNMGFEADPLHYEFVLLKDDAKVPEFHPSNPKLETPRKLWSKLPPFVANTVGGRLSRYLP